ncbi:MAG TPA: phenylalanine--tRNA ligase subunit beta [Acidimicrobiia bacterium]|nr:phenylalanine--tRNA ligase subunit beta [Acidimicrobiia bacterium]
MRAPLSWLRDFTPLDAPVAEIAAALNRVGLEVDAIDVLGDDITGVRAARVLDVTVHPDADRLRLVDLDTGDGTTRVVCGAPNVHPGMLAPFAPAGATLPGGLTLERRTIRGQVSDGMLCSPRELGLGDDHAGILDLDPDTVPGTDVRELLGLDDVVFDLAITPNRPDAMCVVGVARELAAAFILPFHVPEPDAPTDADARRPVTVTVDAPDRCPRYLARVATVTLGDSPPWMQQRLVKAGMRPISNVVDVTNYVLLERNQPLHAFDLDRLAGPGIVVRHAEPGEHLTTLDGVDRTLEPDDLLICDADRVPQALAGIMGGGHSEVASDTTAILLESAYFERMGIARTSKRLKLRSESSARFERGTDPDGVATAAERALELLTHVAAAGVAPDAVDQYPERAARPRIALRTSRVNAILGTALRDTDVLDALRPLEIDVTGGDDDIVAVPPTFRPDLEREIDLIEEVARRVGFDQIGRTVARPHNQVGGLTAAQAERRVVTDALVGAGAAEVATIPLVAPDLLARFGATDPVALTNPLRADESVLRAALLPGLVTTAAANTARGRPDLALFEVGTIFLRPPAGQLLPVERVDVAALLTGGRFRRPLEPDRPVDAYDAVDLVRILADTLELARWDLEAASIPGFHPGRAARLRADGHVVGAVGELHHDVLTAVGLTGPVVAFEADLDALRDAPRRDRAFRPLSPYPPSTIDLAFVVDDAVPAAAIAATLRDAAGGLAEEVRVFDEFRSSELGATRRSLAFALRFRAPDRTLTDADVAELRQRGIDAVTAAYGATLR